MLTPTTFVRRVCAWFRRFTRRDRARVLEQFRAAQVAAPHVDPYTAPDYRPQRRPDPPLLGTGGRSRAERAGW